MSLADERWGMDPSALGKERRDRIFHHIGEDRGALFPGVHRMEDVAGVGLKPAHRLDAGVARHHADMGALVGLPGVGRSAAHCAFEIAGQRQDREERVPAGDEKIVHHA
jgi:hypothetical protein